MFLIFIRYALNQVCCEIGGVWTERYRPFNGLVVGSVSFAVGLFDTDVGSEFTECCFGWGWFCS